MPLRVGDLAKLTGLTVRTLHHYDEIGLLKPSGRSESGYRLYDEADVARLHAIQALRLLGLPLAEIGPALQGAQAPRRIIDQQIQALDDQLRQATELRGRLVVLRDLLLRGQSPGLDDWVRSLSLMATYGRYFDAGEIQEILRAYGAIESEWLALMAEVRGFMDSGGTVDSEPGQVLVRRWMLLMHRWMDGDFERMDRWGAMYQQEVQAHGQGGAPPTDMLAFMQAGIDLRKALLQQHVGDAWSHLRLLPDAQWQAIEDDGQALLRDGEPPTGPRARALKARWLDLLEQASGGDAALRARLETLHLAHPLLLAGLPLGRAVREYLHSVPARA